MSRSRYGAPDSTHDVSLSDGVRTYYFNIKGAPKLVSEDPQVPSTLLTDKTGRSFGDWDPQHAHIEQRSWLGGRGQEDFSLDETKYFDGRTAWTLSPNRITHAPLWGFGEGHAYADVKMPGCKRTPVGNNVLWKPMIGGAYYARSFTATVSPFTMARLHTWIRRIGSPAGTLTLEVRNNSSSAPGSTVHTSATVAATSVAELLTHLYEWTLSPTFLQVASTVYWVVIYSTAADNDPNHWEVGYGTTGTDTCKTSTDGSAWSDSGVQIFFRTMPAHTARRWRHFTLNGADYVVDEQDSGVASTVYILGDRGVATAATSTTLTDSASGLTSGWATDIWDGAWVRIIKGTGRGQYREITANTSTQLTVTPAWTVTPSTDSEYVIYGTNELNVVGSTGITGPVKSVTVFNGIVLFAQGTAINIRRMRWNAATPAHEFEDDGTNKADVLHSYTSAADGVVIWRGLNDTVQVSKAPAAAWATPLTFATAEQVGDTAWMIQLIRDYDGVPYIQKEDSLWYLSGSHFIRVQLGFDTMASPTNGIAAMMWNLAYYFNWAGSVEQLFEGNVDDIGPWLGAGLPTDRRGHVADMIGTNALAFLAVDAGVSNYSSVLAYNKFGFCEVFRGYTANRRCRTVFWQANPGTNPRLWFDYGGDLMWQIYPKDHLNPLRDASVPFHHEFAIEFSTVDMRAARLSKMFNDVSLTTKDLGSTAQIYLDYVLDNDIDSSRWKNAGVFLHSDWQSVDVGEGDRRRIRIRLRGLAQDASAPGQVIASVLEAYARTPVKYQWVMKTDIRSLHLDPMGNIDADPEEFVEWVKEKAGVAKDLVMHSRYGRSMDNVRVMIEPPAVSRTFKDKLFDLMGSTLTVVIREA